MVNEIWDLDIMDILSDVSTNLGSESWMLYVFAAFILGILLGGLVKGIAKLVLGLVMFSGFVVLVLILLQKQDVLSIIASVVFGTIMLVVSFLVKLGKYPLPKG